VNSAEQSNDLPLCATAEASIAQGHSSGSVSFENVSVSLSGASCWTTARVQSVGAARLIAKANHFPRPIDRPRGWERREYGRRKAGLCRQSKAVLSFLV